MRRSIEVDTIRLSRYGSRGTKWTLWRIDGRMLRRFCKGPHRRFAFVDAERARYANTNRAEQCHPDSPMTMMLVYACASQTYQICIYIYIAMDLFNLDDNTPRSSILTPLSTFHPIISYNGFSGTSDHWSDRQARRRGHQRTCQSKCTIRYSRPHT
jgi:hypothetical protein